MRKQQRWDLRPRQGELSEEVGVPEHVEGLPFPLNPHDRGHALGHQLRVGVDDFGLGIGDRPAQVHDLGFADELASPDRPKEVDLLFGILSGS